MENDEIAEFTDALYCRQCHAFAAAGDLAGLLRAREGGCPWDQVAGHHNHRYICCRPAVEGDLVTLKWLREQGCPEPYWRSVVPDAVRFGRTEVVLWACALGLPMSKLAAQEAAASGHLLVLQRLVAAGCPWDPEVCRQEARRRGHGEVEAWVERSVAGEVKEPGEEAPRRSGRA